MSEFKVSLRYAKSVLDLAIEQKKLDAVHKDMELFYAIAKSNSELRAVLSNPIVSGVDKKKILHKLFEGKVDKITLAFFDIMVLKNRLELLYPTSKQFFNLYDQYKGIVEAKFETAVVVDDKLIKEVTSIIQKEIGKEVKLKAVVNPSLIGGFVLTVQDKQIDNSISKKLSTIKKALVNNNYNSSL
jgi:F-type H+-transporting ATPase subunit delta